MKNRRLNGFTLVETLIALMIAGIVGASIYGIWSRANFTRAVATAKGQAKDEADLALRQLAFDIGMARKEPPLDAGTAKRVKMKITQKAAAVSGSQQKYEEIDVTYAWSGTTLMRETSDGKRALTTKLCENDTKVPGGLRISREAGSGTVYIEIVTEVKPEGYSDSPVTHKQDMVVTIREEAAGAGADNRWVKPTDTSLLGNF